MTTGWGWKRSETPEDVLKFINGQAPYSRPVGNAKIVAVSGSVTPLFYTFYTRDASERGFRSWGWKRSETPDDAWDFINGRHAYDRPVTDAEICAVKEGTHWVFYIFYTRDGSAESAGKWGWTRRETPTSVVEYLNGRTYGRPVTTARIAALQGDHYPIFFIFYQRSGWGEIDNWSHRQLWSPSQARAALNGSYEVPPIPVKGAEVAALTKDHTIRICGISIRLKCRSRQFHVFPNQGTRIWLQSPLYDERFVRGEAVRFEAIVTRELPCDGSQLQWTSDLDGHLGNGTLVSTSGLSVGRHTITVSGYGRSETFPVRVFAHLGDLYHAPPAEGEIQRILSHFTFDWENGTGVDEDWSPYDSFDFNQNSTDPSKAVIIAKLDVMRHQRFTESLPMTNGKTIYDHLRAWVHEIRLRLDCGLSMGGGGGMSLARNVSVWDARQSGTATDPDTCKTPFATPSLWPYIHHLQLIVHEGRHSEPGDPYHTNCGEGGPASKDDQLEGGSGYAWAALYMMWVYKYSLYDPPDIRDAAGQEAAWFLRSRFCTTPSHPDPRVQAIIEELLQS